MAEAGRPVLVLGASGQLGGALVRLFRSRGVEAAAPSRSQLDLTDASSLVASVDEMAPGLVLNAAAWTDVAGAEREENRAAAFRMNRDVPRLLAIACRRLRCPLVHVSTDYVFDGTAGRPYREDDPVSPLQVYGKSKREGEEAVLDILPAALVVRTSTLFGPAARARLNYVDSVLRQALATDRIDVVEPPVSSPTYAPDLAGALLELAEAGAQGLVHAVNSGECSRLVLARAVVEAAGRAGDVEVRSRPPRDGDVARPGYSVLDTGRMAGILGRRLRSWREAVDEHVRKALA